MKRGFSGKTKKNKVMGVDTKVAIVKQHEIDELMFEIVKALKNGFGDKFISDSVSWKDVNRGKCVDYLFFRIVFSLDYENSNFENNKENRGISVFYSPKEEMKRDYYNMSMGAWGHNKEIANCLVDYFGGWTNYSDCDNVEIDYCKSQKDSILGESN